MSTTSPVRPASRPDRTAPRRPAARPRRVLTRRQVLRRRRVVVVTGLLLVLLGTGALLVRAGQLAWTAVSDALGASVAVAATGPDAPALLTVPAAGIEEPLAPQGVDENGAINPDRGEVIWFPDRDRAVPGAEGIGVIAGHVEYYGQPDAFARLDEVGVGDGMTITQQDGDVLDLTVIHTEILDKEEVRTSDLVWGDDEDRRLVALVTCDDTLGLRGDGHRAANLVVVAEVD